MPTTRPVLRKDDAKNAISSRLMVIRNPDVAAGLALPLGAKWLALRVRMEGARNVLAQRIFIENVQDGCSESVEDMTFKVTNLASQAKVKRNIGSGYWLNLSTPIVNEMLINCVPIHGGGAMRFRV
ncbi:MAG: hypothetical protein ACM3WS_04945 [Bacillota bacterium]